MRLFSTLAALLLCAPSFAASAAAPAGALSRIGAAAAVRGSVKATAPGAVGRVIGSGKPLFLNDHVVTDAAGKLQVLLLDETVFTLGANADMVLDTFVYDPNTGAGQVAASITKGAFRFVTGKVARNKPENMNVKLKVGTIGVRGTVVVGETGDAGSTIINAGASADNQAGEQASSVLAENNGQTTLISQPGEGVRLLPGQNPGGAADFTAELDRLSNALGEPSKGGQAGGDPAGSADQESGQATGEGKGNAAEGLALANASASDADLVTAVQQQGNGFAKWSDLAQLQGKATYNGSGSFSCAGGGCASSTGAFSFRMDVDFDAKTLGGVGDTVQMSGAATDFGTIQTQSYAGLTGNATKSLQMTTPATTGANFNGTTISFQNANGQTASEAILNMQYSNISTSITNAAGTATGTR